MADKTISELIAAEQITAPDLFVLEQNGTAKKLTGQVLLNWLTKAADGHGGIQSITKTGTSGLQDTYRITMADTTVFDFVVTNGRSINSIAKTSTSGLTDTYTISYNDGTTGTFTVTNGAQGDTGNAWYVWVKWASQEPTETSHSFGDLPDSWMGIYSGTSETAPTDWTKYQWYEIKGEKGDTGDAATLVSAEVTYQVGESGTIVPSGSWSASIPVVAQGKYLWTKIVQTFNTGNPVTAYTISRMGIDGLGSVASVNDVSPDSNGNVKLTAEDVGALPIAGGDMEGPINMNGQILSGLNTPVGDTEAATKGYTLGLVKKAAPRNWLDNSDFRNPIMQEGFDGYHGTTRYPIDRWYDLYGYGAFTKTAHGITIAYGTNHAYLNQKIANGDLLVGKSVTFVVGLYDDSVYLCSGVYVASGYTAITKATDDIAISIENGAVQIVVTAGELGVKWAALYEGEYTAETLPQYVPKGYAAELAECRRYYYRSRPIYQAKTGVAAVTGIEFPIQMRITPTVTCYDATGAEGYVSIWRLSGVSQVSAAAAGVDSTRVYYLNSDSDVDGVACYYIKASADL